MKLWPFGKKSLPTRNSVAFVGGGGGSGWAPPKQRQYITEGYQLNAIVYRAVSEITKAIADIPIELHRGDTILPPTDAALALLAKPNPMQGWDAFIKQAFTDRMILGEVAVYAPGQTPNLRPAELWPICPTEIVVKPGPARIPVMYEHRVGDKVTRIPVDPNGRSRLFFFKEYNPSDHWRGQSPLMAAALAADTHNSGVKWNYKLLRNSARPSGWIKFEGVPDSETVDRLSELFGDRHRGEENAGSVPMLIDGATFVEAQSSPRDMDFLNTSREMAKLVASALGVPLPLIDNDASTFNNMATAREAFYTNTIIPLFREFLSSF